MRPPDGNRRPAGNGTATKSHEKNDASDTVPQGTNRTPWDVREAARFYDAGEAVGELRGHEQGWRLGRAAGYAEGLAVRWEAPEGERDKVCRDVAERLRGLVDFDELERRRNAYTDSEDSDLSPIQIHQRALEDWTETEQKIAARLQWEAEQQAAQLHRRRAG